MKEIRIQATGMALIMCLVIGVAASGASASPAVEAGDTIQVNPDDGTIVFVRAKSLEDAARAEAHGRGDESGSTYERSVVIGETVDGETGSSGCRFRGQVEYRPGSAPSGTVFVQRVVSQNPRGCRMVFESAWLTPATANGLGFDVSGFDGAATSSTAMNGGYSWDGAIKGRTKEIANVDVTKTNSRIKWNSSSHCVTSSWRQSYWWWRNETGWTDVVRTKSDSGSCWHSRFTHGKYKNGVFCLTIDTWVNHEVKFTAKANGASAATWDLSKWGGCSWLLDSEHTYDPN